MIATIIISVITIICLILSIIKYPSITIKGRAVSTFYLATSLGAIVLIAARLIKISEISDVLLSNTSINPLKILVLFISMSLLSIALDEVGFFSYLANKTLKLGKKNQVTLFVVLYVVISILTVFTSNDILILTFTPFICFFAKRANINPMPYLIAEFVSANTFSMMLCIGNPTNMYLSSVYEIGFIEYFKVMALPTTLAGIAAFCVLLLAFRKELKKEIIVEEKDVQIENKFILIVSLIHLSACTITLTISNFIGVEMWLICLGFALSLLLILIVYGIITRKFSVLKNSLLRAPWNLVPFIISMFIIILALDKHGVLYSSGQMLNSISKGKTGTIFTYGVLSTLLSNVLNNIPMTLTISKIIAALPANLTSFGVYASIIGSNLGAYLSPIGALAGIMFINILSKSGIELKASTFIKYGVITVPVVLVVSLLGLCLIM